MGLRHWKQRFEADADLIFSKRMKLGCCGVAIVNPGDRVTDEMKAYLGRNRLRLWWESKRIELARYDGDEGRQLSQDEADERELARLEREEAQRELDVDHSLGGPDLDGEPSDDELEPEAEEQSDDEGESEEQSEESPF